MKSYEKRLNTITRFTPQSAVDELFEEMYSDYSSLIGFVLLPYDLDDDSVKDIINESFFKLFQSRGKVRDVKYFLLTCAKNLAINEKKRVARFTSIDEYEDYFMSPDSRLDFNSKMLVESIVASLSEKEKEIFDLYILQDLSSREVAKLLRLNQNAVRVHWSRTLQKIEEGFKNAWN